MAPSIRDLACVIDAEARFIFAPSWVASPLLLEGKALGTSELADLSLLHDLVRKKDTNLEQFAQARKLGSTVGRRKLRQVQQQTEAALLALLRRWHAKKITERALRRDATKLMKQAWRDVFLAGLRAAGTAPVPTGIRKPGDPLVLLGPGDDKWLQSAMQHEMRFLNRFLDAVASGDWVMPLERRAKMYVHALDAFYDSARLIGLPNNTIIHWVTVGDGRSCVSCQFLADNSPYTTATLPTAPKSGLTACLTNDRCWLYIRRVPPSQAEKVAQAAKYTRDGFIRKLRKIKRVGHP